MTRDECVRRATCEEASVSGPAVRDGENEPTVRVAFVGQRGAEAGGAERSLELLLSHLPARFSSSAVLFEDGAYADELRARGVRVEIVALERDLLDVQRERLPLAAARGTIAMLPRLSAAYRRLRTDLVYTNTVKAHVMGAPAARLAGIPAIMHLRDILDGPARALLRLTGATCTKRRIAISNAVAASLALRRTDVVPNPVDLATYASLPARDDARRELGLPLSVPLVGILGRINRWKGHDRFIRIAALVAERSEAHFAIVGKPMFRDADFAAELPAQAAALGLAARMHFVPWIDDPRVAYAALDVNCNTSNAEPFGRTIIEAAACGVPTVCFEEGGAPEAVGPCGRIVPANDEGAFADAVLDLLQGVRAPQSQAANMGEALAQTCRAYAAQYDAAVHAKRIGAIIDDVVHPQRG